MKDTITTVHPFLVTDNCKKAVDFYSSAFGAVELVSFKNANEKMTAKIAIEGAEFWLSDEEPEFNNLSPTTIGGSPVRIILTTINADHMFEQALAVGALQICPMTTEDVWRIGKLQDPFGHIWEIGYIL